MHRDEMEQRLLLLREARRLAQLGVRFPKGGPGERMGMLDLVDPLPLEPKTLSCSQFVRYVVERVFGSDFWRELVGHDDASVACDGGARTMHANLQEAASPQLADLRFFGSDEADDWHVMLVSSPTTLIGACPGDRVREVPGDYFSEMPDRGARQMPLPEVRTDENWFDALDIGRDGD